MKVEFLSKTRTRLKTKEIHLENVLLYELFRNVKRLLHFKRLHVNNLKDEAGFILITCLVLIYHA